MMTQIMYCKPLEEVHTSCLELRPPSYPNLGPIIMVKVQMKNRNHEGKELEKVTKMIVHTSETLITELNNGKEREKRKEVRDY